MIRACRLGVVMVVASVALSACGDGADPAAPTPGPASSGPERGGPPPGFTTHLGPGFSFAYPSSWSLAERTSSRGEPYVQVLGPEGANGLPPEVVVAQNPGRTQSFGELMDTFRAMVGVQPGGRRFLADRPAEVDGAEAAQLTEAEYEEKGTKVPVRTFDLHVLTPGDVLYNLFVRVPAADVDRVPVRAIVDSFRLR